MSSPVSKLRKFSRFFSPRRMATPDLSSTVEDSANFGRCSTQETSSPKACSTPKFGPTTEESVKRTTESWNFSCVEPESANEHRTVAQDVSGFGKCLVENRLSSVSPYKYLQSRKRHFGVSDIPINRHIHKVKYTHKADHASTSTSANESHHKFKRCSVFSASVAPSTPKHNFSRLSGVALSPSSVTWASESPLPLSGPARGGSSSRFRWREIPSRRPGRRRRLQETTEQCPVGKYYFWEDDESELSTAEQLGRGGFGKVFEGRYRGEKVAIKKIENAFKSRQAVLETLQGEMNGLRLRHPNIVRTLVVMQPTTSPGTNTNTRSYCYVVMEHAGSRNLSQLINDANEEISPVRRYRFSTEILRALSYLHDKNLVHLDLKPSNVIVTSDDICKVCDFGSCLKLGNDSQENTVDKMSRDGNCNITGCSDSLMSTNSTMLSAPVSSKSSNGSEKSSSQLMGTFIYRAPELLRGFLPCTKSDIYSFSVTAWQLWSRVLPYAGQHNHATVFAVVAFGARPKVPQFSIPSAESCEQSSEKLFFDLVTSCWQSEAEQRPTATKAIEVLRSCQDLINQ